MSSFSVERGSGNIGVILHAGDAGEWTGELAEPAQCRSYRASALYVSQTAGGRTGTTVGGVPCGTASRLFIGVYPFRADRRKRRSGSLRPGPAFRNAELSSQQEEASDLAVRTTAGAVDELRQPVRAHARRVDEQMRRRSPFVRTAPPASTRHVQPSGVCFHLAAALPNFASSVVGPYRMLSYLSDTLGQLALRIAAPASREVSNQFANAAGVSRRTLTCQQK